MEINDDVLKIMFLLRKNPRRSFLEISRITGIDLEEIFQTYYALKENNMIRAYTFLDIQDRERLIDIILIIKIHKRELLEYLKRSVNVNSISITDREYLIHCSFLSLKDYDSFLEVLEFLNAEIVNDYFINSVII
ncbi:MAG: hypothetical protein ACP5NV_04510 [Candidatus Woesearchaeota archaeon]